MQIFQRQNNSSITEVVMIDKDLIELKVLEKRFNWAKVLYCRFHVIKTFKSVCPKVNKSIKDQLLEILEKMVYAETCDTLTAYIVCLF